mgnify:CR=1 FL=1
MSPATYARSALAALLLAIGGLVAAAPAPAPRVFHVDYGIALTPDVHHLDPYRATAAEIDAFRARIERLNLGVTIEGGARCGYVNPDETTFAYLQGRSYAPSKDAWDRALALGTPRG